MNGEVYNVGTVVNDETNNTTTIVGIILGIVAALVVGASLALAVMVYLRKKKTGEETRGKKTTQKVADVNIPSLRGRFVYFFFFFFILSAEIENRLSTMLYQHRTSSTADFSPTGDYRRGQSLTNLVKLNRSFVCFFSCLFCHC